MIMIIIIVHVIYSSCNILMPVYHTAITGGGGGNLHDFGYEPHPIHLLGEVKKQTHSYTSHIENCTHSYTIFQILLIHILFGWKRYPIYILLMWKWYPFIYLEAWEVYAVQSHVCIYLYIGSQPPPVTANTTTRFRGGWYPGYHLPCPPPARGALHGKIGGNGLGSTNCQVHIFPYRAPLPRGKVHT